MPNRVLLTGAGGFVGSHCLKYFLQHTDWDLLLLDSFRHKGTLQRIEEEIQSSERVQVLKHDLTVPISLPLENLIMGRSIDDRGNILEKKLDIIFNIASDSAVERSVVDPISCLRNNFELGLNMLEFARRVKPGKFVMLSSDEIYGEALDSPHREWEPYLPSNPYSASKGIQNLMGFSYWRTYDVPVVTGICMNMIGEKQDPEKFLPKLIQWIATGREMPIYADSPEKIGSRVYLHAENLADALIFISKLPVAMYRDGATKPDVYNVCGDTELNNLEMAKLVAEIMGKPLQYRLVPSESARRGYDRRYALDGSKLKNLGWKMPLPFRESLERIVKWTIKNPHWMV